MSKDMEPPAGPLLDTGKAPLPVIAGVLDAHTSPCSVQYRGPSEVGVGNGAAARSRTPASSWLDVSL